MKPVFRFQKRKESGGKRREREEIHTDDTRFNEMNRKKT